MSIQYKLFGKPKTLDEFVDKAKKTGINKISVLVAAYDDAGNLFGEGFFNYHCRVGLLAGKIRLKLGEHTHIRFGHLYHTVIGKAEVEKEAFTEAVETAERLSNLGFEVTINGKPVNEVKEALEQYDKGIQEMKQKLGIS